nr:hypothetical protein [Candidatus Woesearchaeota archaeon]
MTFKNYVAKAGELSGLASIAYLANVSGAIPKLYEISDQIGRQHFAMNSQTLGMDASLGDIALTLGLLAGATAGYRKLQNYVNTKWP